MNEVGGLTYKRECSPFLWAPMTLQGVSTSQLQLQACGAEEVLIQTLQAIPEL